MFGNESWSVVRVSFHQRRAFPRPPWYLGRVTWNLLMLLMEVVNWRCLASCAAGAGAISVAVDEANNCRQACKLLDSLVAGDGCWIGMAFKTSLMSSRSASGPCVVATKCLYVANQAVRVVTERIAVMRALQSATLPSRYCVVAARIDCMLLRCSRA